MARSAQRPEGGEGRPPFVPPYVYLTVAILSLSFSAIFVRLSESPPTVVAFYRLALSGAVLFLVDAVQRGMGAGGRAASPRLPGGFQSRQDVAWAALAGVALAAHYGVWFASLQYTSVSSSTMLVTLQPIFVVALAFLWLKERVPAPSMVGLVLAVAGSYVITSYDSTLSPEHLYGDMLALGAAALISFYILIGRRLSGRVATVRYVTVVYASGAIALLFWNVVSGHALTGLPKEEWLLFFGLALVSTVFGHTVLNWLLRYLRAATVSVSFLGEPVGASALAYVVLGEAVAFRQIAGGVVVLLGIALFLTFNESRRTAVSPSPTSRRFDTR